MSLSFQEYSVTLLLRVVSTSRSRSPAAPEILFHHLLLLLSSFVFLFFNPYP